MKYSGIIVEEHKNGISSLNNSRKNLPVKKKLNYNFSTFFAPLDIATIFYILISGIYLCFGISKLDNVLPHFVLRLVGLSIIVGICYLNQKYSGHFIGLLKSIYPMLFLSFFYFETAYLKNIIFSNNFDPYIVRAEQWLWGCQPSIEFANFMPHHWFNEFMNICYFSYFPLIWAVGIVVYFGKKQHCYRSIFTIIFSFYMYYMLYDIIPVIGPQFHFNTFNIECHPPHFFGKLMHYILTNLEKPTGAFPSSHAGIALIISYILYKQIRVLFYYSLPFVLGICFATVYIQEHYLIDIFAAILTVPIFITVSGFVYDKLYVYLRLKQGSKKALV
ncbi:MAG TPA: phosphatase PAP2 family protein [Bacteroidia bacterium]